MHNFQPIFNRVFVALLFGYDFALHFKRFFGILDKCESQKSSKTVAIIKRCCISYDGYTQDVIIIFCFILHLSASVFIKKVYMNNFSFILWQRILRVNFNISTVILSSRENQKTISRAYTRGAPKRQ